MDVAKKRDGDLLTPDEITTIDQVVSELRDAMEGDSHTPIQDLTETLEKITAGFAHRRMDRALSEGFKDMQVDELERVVSSDEDNAKNTSEDV